MLAPAVNVASAPLVEHIAFAPAVSATAVCDRNLFQQLASCGSLAPANDYVAPASALYAALAPVVEYTSLFLAVHAAPAPVFESALRSNTFNLYTMSEPVKERHGALTPVEKRLGLRVRGHCRVDVEAVVMKDSRRNPTGVHRLWSFHHAQTT